MSLTKSEQIQWLVDWHLNQPDYGYTGLCATDFDLMNEFIEATGADLSWACWRSRIRDAADRLGLIGNRVYIAESSPGAGLPLYTMVYS